jgi:hypothetical protein
MNKFHELNHWFVVGRKNCQGEAKNSFIEGATEEKDPKIPMLEWK